MPHEPIVVKIDPESELGHTLRESMGPVVLDASGVRYDVIKASGDPFAGYDPARIRAGLKRFAGLITPEEAERMKALVYRGREEGTRRLDRP